MKNAMWKNSAMERRGFVGGSDARIIMGEDEGALVRLWREKRGEAEPEDLLGNLIVQLGVVTEDLNRRWYEANTGQVITDVQQRVFHPALKWMAATLDGRVAGSDAVFEAKFMLPWSFSEEAAATKYMPQLQHNMWVMAARTAVLSVITGASGHASSHGRGAGNGHGSGRLDARSPNLAARTPLPRQGKADNRVNQARAAMHSAVLLSFEASGGLRDQMLGELNAIGSEDEAAKWAHRRLPDKNKLNAIDAKHIEELFRAKLKAFALHHAEGLSPSEHGSEAAPAVEPVEPGTETDAPEPKRKPRGKSVDKSVLSHPEPRRIRDRDHVRFVAQQACLICGRKPSDPHHLRFAQSRALGRKASDEFTVPLCRGHHRELHRHGDEAKWWNKAAVDPLLYARTLWRITHPLRIGPRLNVAPTPTKEDPEALFGDNN